MFSMRSESASQYRKFHLAFEHLTFTKQCFLLCDDAYSFLTGQMSFPLLLEVTMILISRSMPLAT